MGSEPAEELLILQCKLNMTADRGWIVAVTWSLPDNLRPGGRKLQLIKNGVQTIESDCIQVFHIRNSSSTILEKLCDGMKIIYKYVLHSISAAPHFVLEEVWIHFVPSHLITVSAGWLWWFFLHGFIMSFWFYDLGHDDMYCTYPIQYGRATTTTLETDKKCRSGSCKYHHKVFLVLNITAIYKGDLSSSLP